MRSITTLIGLLVLCLPTTPTAHPKWPLARLLQSVVPVVIGTGEHCSGFIVREKPPIYLTAEHCMEYGPVSVDSMLATRFITKRDYTKDDIAVLYIRGANARPALKLGKEPKVGQPVLTVGFAMNTLKPFFWESYIIMLDDSPWGIGEGTPWEGRTWLITRFGNLPGNSGSPVVDERGNLVSLHQVTDEYRSIGGGVPYRVMKQLMEELLTMTTR